MEKSASAEAVVYLGERIWRLREERALRQEELAERVGIGKNPVNRLERDLTEPRPPTLRKLAQPLEVDPAELAED